MNRDDDNPPRSQPDASGKAASGGAGGDGDDDKDGDDHHGRRRHYRYPRYHQDDTQVYGTSGSGGRTQGGGGGAPRGRLQDECDRGYEDGLRAGEKDARKGLSSDPQRWTLYRNGGETLSRSGRPGDAKQAYRDCFLRGYGEAYNGMRLNPSGASPND